MSPTSEQLLTSALTLPESERLELAEALLRSLNDQEEEGAREAWLGLAEQRMAEVRAGKVVGVPAEEVLKNLLGPRQ